MTTQEFEARGQDYADFRDALREIQTLRAINVQLIAACEYALRVTSAIGHGLDVDDVLSTAIEKARKEVS